MPATAEPVASADMPPASAEALQRLAHIQTLPGDFGRALALHLFDDQLDAAGVERLLDQAGDLRHADDRATALSILYARYAELDPAAALRHIQGRGRQGLGYAADRWLTSVFRAWARSDLDAALLHAETLNPHQRPIVGAAILRARDDLPQEVRAEIAERFGRWGALQHLVQRSAADDGGVADDPAGAWRQVLAQGAGHARSEDLEQVIKQWAATDPAAALDAIGSSDGISWRRREELGWMAMRSWAASDPTAALGWAMAQPDSPLRSRLIRSGLYAWAEADPRAAASWMSASANGTAGRRTLEAVARSYAARYPDEAAEWALSLPAADASRALDIVLSHRIAALSDADPERAALLLDRIADADSRRTAERKLVNRWRRVDPDAALAWVDRLGDADERTTLYASMFDDWFGGDPAAALGHLDRLNDPRTRDRAVLAMMLDWKGTPHYGMSVAEMLFERLQTEAARHEAAAIFYEYLRDIDPARAERYR